MTKPCIASTGYRTGGSRTLTSYAFEKIFLFTRNMSQEVAQTGFRKMANYIFAIGADKQNKSVFMRSGSVVGRRHPTCCGRSPNAIATGLASSVSNDMKIG